MERERTLPRVDPERCLGYGLCNDEAPNVFVLGDSGISDVRPEVDSIDPKDFDAVEAAIAACPTNAISWKRNQDG